MQLRRPRGVTVMREIQALTRAFPSKSVEFYRVRPAISTKGQSIPGTGIKTSVYRGEALYIPAGGVVDLFGGGQVERTSPTLIVTGNYPIGQGDLVELDGRTYQVENPLNHFGYFLEIRLQQFRQAVRTPQ